MQSTLLQRITINPNVCHGKPTIRDKRYPVEVILSYLAGGDTVETLLTEFPDLEKEDILACLHYAAESAKTKSAHLIVS
jgi:uncharacterized protein (DUF433 family)